ncbi:glycosyltransferase [Seonamhaeicola aphaedonensis]|uniref:Glycosyltransferase involved in cell wall biosynthesis n=1 Tax=Seonamhaeicola aphaedonensis TaxID=1461338 RepID=A0A3D9HFV7_9FLAO|nr:glycosyltransferase [Seonamhaeicola aphaedonensis]RED48350.1 glycosyltransferase involved in cell wall biosynthesis [Seonamhaeicola aphaedonensis]
MKLAIISHTEHYISKDNQLVGWGATVSEINHLLDIFDEVYHIAMLYDTDAPASALPYVSEKIHFIPIPSVGGKGVYNKLKIIWQSPKTIRVVSKTLEEVDCFQLRTPTGIGVFLIPYLSLFVKKTGWFKYAGNWNQKQPPLGYRLQRWMLKCQKRTVTMNGYWEHQPKQHLSFENPCLTEVDIALGRQIRQKKFLGDKISFCFVGRLEREKGVETILKTFDGMNANLVSRIGTIHFVGTGEELAYFKALANKSECDIVFHGALPRAKVYDIYKQSDVFLLPTKASEGFPKVIAEAMNFGCIPIVSNISAIGHYIKQDDHGFLLHEVSQDALMAMIDKMFNLSEENYRKMLESFDAVVEKFTFSHYNSRINLDILKL